jgi:hypothetical protein
MPEDENLNNEDLTESSDEIEEEETAEPRAGVYPENPDEDNQ